MLSLQLEEIKFGSCCSLAPRVSFILAFIKPFVVKRQYNLRQVTLQLCAFKPCNLPTFIFSEWQQKSRRYLFGSRAITSQVERVFFLLWVSFSRFIAQCVPLIFREAWFQQRMCLDVCPIFDSYYISFPCLLYPRVSRETTYIKQYLYTERYIA